MSSAPPSDTPPMRLWPRSTSLIATDDRLLATSNVINLMSYIGPGRAAVVEPVIQRMLASPYEHVQQWGGFLAARAGLEFGLGHLLAAARESDVAPSAPERPTCAPGACRTPPMPPRPPQHFSSSCTTKTKRCARQQPG